MPRSPERLAETRRGGKEKQEKKLCNRNKARLANSHGFCLIKYLDPSSAAPATFFFLKSSRFLFILFFKIISTRVNPQGRSLETKGAAEFDASEFRSFGGHE